MSELAKVLRKQREFPVKIGKFTFTVRRPTDVEAIEIHTKAMDFSQLAQAYVVGWDGVTEDDIRGGGGSTVASPFDLEDWREWCADRPDFWQPIGNALWEKYSQHIQKAEAVAKN